MSPSSPKTGVIGDMDLKPSEVLGDYKCFIGGQTFSTDGKIIDLGEVSFMVGKSEDLYGVPKLNKFADTLLVAMRHVMAGYFKINMWNLHAKNDLDLHISIRPDDKNNSVCVKG